MDRREVTETLSTYQVEPMSFRASLVEGMARGWQCTILDVKQAFLSAFMKGTEQDIFILPPAMLHKHGYCEKGELYRVVRALYGLKQSPKRWQEHRDKTLQGLRVVRETGSSTSYQFEQSCTDKAVWFVRKGISGGAETSQRSGLHGILLTYVDDFLLLCEQEANELVIKGLQNVYDLKAPEPVLPGHPRRFWG